MRATLVYPAFEDYSELDGTWLPHGVCGIATEANARGHQVDILDGRLYPIEDAKRLMGRSDSQLFGFSCLSANMGYALELISFIRENTDAKIVVGGIHPTVCPEDFPEYDWLVMGEGEITFCDILDGKVEEGVIEGVTPDLAEVLQIDRSLVAIEEKPMHNMEEPFATVIIGRGCPFDCTFCQPAERKLFGRKLRMRPVHSVVDELESLNVKSFMVHDDCFLSSKKYVREFCAALPGGLTWWCQGRADLVCDNIDMVSEMRDAGLSGMIIGHESGDQRVLDYLNKGVTVEQNLESTRILNALGVMTWSNIMLGIPNEPPSAAINTIAMIKAMAPQVISTAVFTPHPGSYMYEECKDIMPEHDWTYFNRGKFEEKLKGVDYNFVAWTAQQLRS